MAISRTYRCDLCRDLRDAGDLIGLYWTSTNGRAKWEIRRSVDVETHICPRCLSTLQSFDAICGGGFKCRGGPDCGSDHK